MSLKIWSSTIILGQNISPPKIWRILGFCSISKLIWSLLPITFWCPTSQTRTSAPAQRSGLSRAQTITRIGRLSIVRVTWLSWTQEASSTLFQSKIWFLRASGTSGWGWLGRTGTTMTASNWALSSFMANCFLTKVEKV